MPYEHLDRNHIREMISHFNPGLGDNFKIVGWSFIPNGKMVRLEVGAQIFEHGKLNFVLGSIQCTESREFFPIVVTDLLSV